MVACYVFQEDKVAKDNSPDILPETTAAESEVKSTISSNPSLTLTLLL